MVDIDALVQALAGKLDPDALSRDPDLRALMSQDVFYRSEDVALVARPASAEQVAAVVAAASAHGGHVVVRGGGMSYTGGYISPDPAGAVLLDMRGMDRIVEINAEDMYVVVEAGCTWERLHGALDPLGLRTPYWGTLSGRKATIGGAISQNAIFWGSGTAGSAVDSVIGLEVVNGRGEIIRTGSLGVRGSNPFCRHFGPDLTGLFTADAGAMGIKTAVVLRLVRKPLLAQGLSFVTPDIDALCALMTQAARMGLPAQQMGLDDGLKTARLAAAAGIGEDLRTAWQVMRAAGNPFSGVAHVARMALAGRKFLDDMPFSAHLFVEGDSEAALLDAKRRLLALAAGVGARQVPGSVPQAMLAAPFPPLNGVTGPRGERWVPLHCVLPLSLARRGYDTLAAVFADHGAAMERHGITLSWLFTTIGNHAFVIEPMLFWPDALEALHRDTIGPKRTARFEPVEERTEARAAVAAIRQAAVAAVDALGALHIQIGGFYGYRDRLEPSTATLLDGIRELMGTGKAVNPQALSR
ncbi:FAD-binding oxidoreductase [Novosphingobium sp. BL-52-GroH]|uniref:FAD-binding oxidoreductase n=1 Tax=Novosphingobium sp. BL-52-GroH TaxID=3349877 RepID=UPI00384CD6FF